MSRLARCSLDADSRPLRLLMIDDSPKVLAVLRCLLAEQRGVVVVGSASSAEPGLEVARTLRPDVVLLDVRMPGMGGLAAVPLFKRLLPPPIVVLMTMYADIAVHREAERAGADSLVAKTDVDAERLLALLAALRK
jgi:DNA-binding NarL/FixJ family response regulator